MITTDGRSACRHAASNSRPASQRDLHGLEERRPDAEHDPLHWVGAPREPRRAAARRPPSPAPSFPPPAGNGSVSTGSHCERPAAGSTSPADRRTGASAPGPRNRLLPGAIVNSSTSSRLNPSSMAWRFDSVRPNRPAATTRTSAKAICATTRIWLRPTRLQRRRPFRRAHRAGSPSAPASDQRGWPESRGPARTPIQ